MRILALDTTTRAGSLALLDGERVVVERTGDAARTHAERLPGELLDALADAGWSTSDVDVYAVASGPGSFTGLRIGIATIQGLAFVHGARVAPVSALRALAEAAAQGRPAGTRVGAWMDAFRQEVFSALYEVRIETAGGASTLVEVEGPMVGTPTSAVARWASRPPSVLCGDGAVLYAASVPAGTTVMPSPRLAPIIASLAAASDGRGQTVSPAGLQPLYVRRPDAEIARDAARQPS